MMEPREGDTLPFFLQKLWQIVCDESSDRLISWSEDGKAFFVIQQEQFSHEILPQYFKHRNFSSFVRQLNMYGFHKLVATENGLSSSGEEIGFSHPAFVQGRPDLLDQIKRKVNPRNTQIVPQQSQQMTKDDLDVMVQSLHEMKNRQDQVVTALSSLTRDKDGLWSEVLTLRQQVTRQDAVIKKLLGFIGQCVTQGSLPLKRPHLAITQVDDLDGSQYKVGSMSSPPMPQNQLFSAATASVGQPSSMSSSTTEDFVRPTKVVFEDDSENVDDLDFVLSPRTMSELLPDMSSAMHSAPAGLSASMMSSNSGPSSSDMQLSYSMAPSAGVVTAAATAASGAADAPAASVFSILPPDSSLNPKCIRSCGHHIENVQMGIDGVQKYLSSSLDSNAVDQLFDSTEVFSGNANDPFQSGVADPFTGVPISSPPDASTGTVTQRP